MDYKDLVNRYWNDDLANRAQGIVAAAGYSNDKEKIQAPFITNAFGIDEYTGTNAYVDRIAADKNKKIAEKYVEKMTKSQGLNAAGLQEYFGSFIADNALVKNEKTGAYEEPVRNKDGSYSYVPVYDDLSTLYIDNTAEGKMKLGVGVTAKGGFQGRYDPKLGGWLTGEKGITLNDGALAEIVMRKNKTEELEYNIHTNKGMLESRAAGVGKVDKAIKDAYGAGYSEYTNPDAPLWNIGYKEKAASLPDGTYIMDAPKEIRKSDIIAPFAPVDNEFGNAIQSIGSAATKLGADIVALPFTVASTLTEAGRKKDSFSGTIAETLTGDGADEWVDSLWGYDNRSDQKFASELAPKFEKVNDIPSLIEFTKDNLFNINAFSLAMQSIPESIATMKKTGMMTVVNTGRFLDEAEQNAGRALTAPEILAVTAAATAYTYTDAVVDKFVFLGKGPLQNVVDKAFGPAMETAKKFGLSGFESLANKVPGIAGSAVKGAGYVAGKAGKIGAAGVGSMIVEGSTEGIQAVPEYLATHIGDVSASKLNTDEMMKSVGENALMGAITAPWMKGVMGSGQAIKEFKDDYDSMTSKPFTPEQIQAQRVKEESEARGYTFSADKNSFADLTGDPVADQKSYVDRDRAVRYASGASATSLAFQAAKEFTGNKDLPSLKDIDGNEVDLKTATGNLVNTIHKAIVTSQDAETRKSQIRMSNEMIARSARVAVQDALDQKKLGLGLSLDDRYKIVDSIIASYGSELDDTQLDMLKAHKHQTAIKEWGAKATKKSEASYETVGDQLGDGIGSQSEVKTSVKDLQDLINRLDPMGSINGNGPKGPNVPPTGADAEAIKIANKLRDYINQWKFENPNATDDEIMTMDLSQIKTLQDVTDEIREYGFIDVVMDTNKASIKNHFARINDDLLAGNELSLTDRDGKVVSTKGSLKKLEDFQQGRLRGKGNTAEVVEKRNVYDQLPTEVAKIKGNNVKYVPKSYMFEMFKQRTKYRPELDYSQITVNARIEESNEFIKKAVESVELIENIIKSNPALSQTSITNYEHSIEVFKRMIATQNDHIKEYTDAKAVLDEDRKKLAKGEDTTITYYMPVRDEDGKLLGYKVRDRNGETNDQKNQTNREKQSKSGQSSNETTGGTSTPGGSTQGGESTSGGTELDIKYTHEEIDVQIEQIKDILIGSINGGWDKYYSLIKVKNPTASQSNYIKVFDVNINKNSEKIKFLPSALLNGIVDMIKNNQHPNEIGARYFQYAKLHKEKMRRKAEKEKAKENIEVETKEPEVKLEQKNAKIEQATELRNQVLSRLMFKAELRNGLEGLQDGSAKDVVEGVKRLVNSKQGTAEYANLVKLHKTVKEGVDSKLDTLDKFIGAILTEPEIIAEALEIDSTPDTAVKKLKAIVAAFVKAIYELADIKNTDNVYSKAIENIMTLAHENAKAKAKQEKQKSKFSKSTLKVVQEIADNYLVVRNTDMLKAEIDKSVMTNEGLFDPSGKNNRNVDEEAKEIGVVKDKIEDVSKDFRTKLNSEGKRIRYSYANTNDEYRLRILETLENMKDNLNISVPEGFNEALSDARGLREQVVVEEPIVTEEPKQEEVKTETETKEDDVKTENEPTTETTSQEPEVKEEKQKSEYEIKIDVLLNDIAAIREEMKEDGISNRKIAKMKEDIRAIVKDRKTVNKKAILESFNKIAEYNSEIAEWKKASRIDVDELNKIKDSKDNVASKIVQLDNMIKNTPSDKIDKIKMLKNFKSQIIKEADAIGRIKYSAESIKLNRIENERISKIKDELNTIREDEKIRIKTEGKSAEFKAKYAEQTKLQKELDIMLKANKDNEAKIIKLEQNKKNIEAKECK